MATHSSILAWRIPWMEEPGGPQSMGAEKNQTRLSDTFTSVKSFLSLGFLICKMKMINTNTTGCRV